MREYVFTICFLNADILVTQKKLTSMVSFSYKSLKVFLGGSELTKLALESNSDYFRHKTPHTE